MKKNITSIIFFLFSASMLLGQGPYYMNLDDASGFDRSPYQTQLEAAAAEIIEVLPEEYQSQFKVFDAGFYLHNEVFVDGFAPSLDRAKTIAASQSPYYLLFVKETTKEGLYTNFRVEVVLPRNPSFPCATEEMASLAKQFTLIATKNNFQNSSGAPFAYVEAEIQGMIKFKQRVNHAFNCCMETEENSCTLDIPTNQEMADLLTSSYIHPSARYVRLENVSIVSNTEAPQGYGLSRQVSVTIDDAINGSLAPVSLTDDLVELQTEGTANGFTVNIKLDYFNAGNFIEDSIVQHVADLPEGTTSHSPPIGASNVNSLPTSYNEHLIILNLHEGTEPPIILTKLGVEYDGAGLFNVDNPRNNNDLQENVLVLPIVAYVGKIIVKRAIMASVNVAINMVMHVAIEKIFGHDGCSWSEAFFASNLTGWHIAVWAAEGALTGGVTGYVKNAFASGFFSAAEYVMTEPSSSFQVSGVFIRFGGGVILGVGFGVLAEFMVKAHTRYLSKININIPFQAFQEAGRKFFDSKYISNNLENGFFDGLSRWFQSFDALRSFGTLREQGWCIDLMKKYKAQFTDVNNTDIRQGITDAVAGTTERKGLLKYCIDGLGCFVAGTPVLMANNPFKNLAPAMAVAAAMPIIAVPIQEVQLLDYAVAHETVNSTYGLTASTDDDIYLGLTDKDPYTSDQQRERDEYEINDRDWNEVVFEEVYGGSTAKLALHNDWIDRKGYQVDAVVEMNLPEQGISGPFRITSIKHIIPQKKPVDEDETDDYNYRPVTALFTHESNQVYNISFDNGDELGVTYQHPIYSTTAGDWKLAGELEIGEEVLTKSGSAKVVSSTKKDGSETVYNLEVKELHNFLVGKSGIVVHNNYGIAQAIVNGLKNIGKQFDYVLGNLNTAGRCADKAKALRAHLRSKGHKNVVSERLQYLDANGNPIQGQIGWDVLDANGNILETHIVANNGFHEFTRINGKVYDNINPNGIDYADFKARLVPDHAMGIHSFDFNNPIIITD